MFNLKNFEISTWCRNFVVRKKIVYETVTNNRCIVCNRLCLSPGCYIWSCACYKHKGECGRCQHHVAGRARQSALRLLHKLPMISSTNTPFPPPISSGNLRMRPARYMATTAPRRAPYLRVANGMYGLRWRYPSQRDHGCCADCQD